MPKERPRVLSIAGFDPSGGAGVLADIKTFEQHKVHGLSVNTGNTLQTTTKFYSIEWTDLKNVLNVLCNDQDNRATLLGGRAYEQYTGSQSRPGARPRRADAAPLS